MKTQELLLQSKRLTLIPYTVAICTSILAQDFTFLEALGLKKGKNWPDKDVLDTLPKIIYNLNKIGMPTGFESWLIIKNDTNEIIGDAGFKGLNRIDQSADIGYGIIEEERRKGYALETCQLLIDWAFSHDDLTYITAACYISNTSSANLLRKMNFELVIEDEEMLHWSLTRS